MFNFLKINKIIALMLVPISSLAYFYWQNNQIVISKFNYKNSKVPHDFNGFKIVQISDLHNKMFGKGQEYIIKKLRIISPDIIVITGDLIDRRKYNLESAMLFINKAIKLAQIYYVPGNHEAWSGKYNDIKIKLINAGVIVLDNEIISLRKGDGSIKILGLSDPSKLTDGNIQIIDTEDLKAQLKKWTGINGFKILLSHRPELFKLYQESNMDMIFSGHAHGGQIRIPFLGGLFAPNQGYFPKYDAGRYDENNSVLFVSRGLGNSVFPIRAFNRPEIIEVDLYSN